jgi:hypothetical protein
MVVQLGKLPVNCSIGTASNSQSKVKSLPNFGGVTRNVRGSHHEWSLTCCTMCQKVHSTPSACVSDCTPNDGLTLNILRTFAFRLSNVGQKPDQLILIHSDFFSYKYPHPYPFHLIFRPFLQLDPKVRVRVRVRERERERENEFSWFLFFKEVTFLT